LLSLAQTVQLFIILEGSREFTSDASDLESEATRIIHLPQIIPEESTTQIEEEQQKTSLHDLSASQKAPPQLLDETSESRKSGDLHQARTSSSSEHLTSPKESEAEMEQRKHTIIHKSDKDLSVNTTATSRSEEERDDSRQNSMSAPITARTPSSDAFAVKRGSTGSVQDLKQSNRNVSSMIASLQGSKHSLFHGKSDQMLPASSKSTSTGRSITSIAAQLENKIKALPAASEWKSTSLDTVSQLNQSHSHFKPKYTAETMGSSNQSIYLSASEGIDTPDRSKAAPVVQRNAGPSFGNALAEMIGKGKLASNARPKSTQEAVAPVLTHVNFCLEYTYRLLTRSKLS